MKTAAYDEKGILQGATRAGEAMRAAMASGGACLIIAIEKSEEGLNYRYFHFCLLNPAEILQVVEGHAYVGLARETESRMKEEITVRGPVN